MFAQVQQSVVQGHIADADLACDKQLLQLTAAAAAGKKGKGKGAGAGAGGGGGGPSLASLQQARVRTQLLGAVADMDTKLEAVARDDHTDAVHGHGSHHEAAAAALRCVQDYAAAEGTCVALMAGRLEAAAASLGALREEAADCHTLGMAAEANGLEERRRWKCRRCCAARECKHDWAMWMWQRRGQLGAARGTGEVPG
jgi:hypothetical protein